MSEQEWRLVPCDPKWSQPMLNEIAQYTLGDPRPLYGLMLAAAPPMPRAEFDAMVERAARATFLMRNGSKTCWAWDSSGLDDEHPGARERYLKDAETAIRAALPGLTVEGE